MNKYRLVKVTVDDCTHYEIQEKGWFVWNITAAYVCYENAVKGLKRLNHIPIITREVINIDE